MKFKQFYLGCLSHASYYIGSGEEAAIIDPQRDVAQISGRGRGATARSIKYIIETHSHADFVSGHIELAKKTGAAIIYGERARHVFSDSKGERRRPVDARKNQAQVSRNTRTHARRHHDSGGKYSKTRINR